MGPNRLVPSGESGMWGDYHLLELAVMIKRENEGRGPSGFLMSAGLGAGFRRPSDGERLAVLRGSHRYHEAVAR